MALAHWNSCDPPATEVVPMAVPPSSRAVDAYSSRASGWMVFSASHGFEPLALAAA